MGCVYCAVGTEYLHIILDEVHNYNYSERGAIFVSYYLSQCCLNIFPTLCLQTDIKSLNLL